MATYVFTPQQVAGRARVRFDTASGSTSAATISPLQSPAFTIPGAELVADGDGNLPQFTSSSATLYQKTLNYNGATVTATVTLTGKAAPTGDGNDPRTGLDGTYAPLTAAVQTVSGVRIAALGDSITANYGNANAGPENALLPVQVADNHLSTALIRAKQVARWDGAYATAGYTLEQMRDTILPTILAKNPLPAAVFLLGGTNNVGANGGAGFSASAAVSVVNDIYTALKAKGIRLICATIPPRADSTTVNQNVDNYNRALRTWCDQNRVDLADAHRALVDQYTSVYKTGYGQNDGGIHPSYLGTSKMADAIVPILTSRFGSVSAPIAATVADATNLIASGRGLFGADTNADGIADGWSSFSGSNYTFSIVTDADGVTKWQRITVGSTSTGSGLLQWSGSSLCSPGDVIELCARVQVSGFEAALVAPTGASGGTGPAWTVSASFTGASGSVGLSAAYGIHTDVADGVVYARGTVGAGASGQIKVNLQTTGAPASGTCYVQIANVALRNLTRLGLTS